MRPITLCVLALVLLAACDRPAGRDRAPRAAVPVAGPAPTPAAAKRVVQRITGEVTPANAARFAELVSEQTDGIIGLKLTVRPGTEADFAANRYLADQDGELFVVSIGDGDAEGDGTEVVMPKGEADYLHGLYVVDGFYTVKPGGMHQGIVSYGLQKVDPAGVLLNPAVVVRDEPLP